MICYYPSAQNRTLHLTVFLQAKDSLTAKPGFVHAGSEEVEFTPSAKYAEYKKSGFLHLRLASDEPRRARVADVAKVWAGTAKRTPYGSTPTTKQVGSVANPNANRFSGMRATPVLTAIPFDFTALVRLLKWADRANRQATLSEKRGITCAAFFAACHQSAAMLAYLEGAGGLTKLEDAARKSSQMLETEAALRQRLNLKEIIPAKNSTTGKPVYQDQALRANSNRTLPPGKSVDRLDYIRDLDQTQLYGFEGAAPTPLDLQ